MIKALKLKDLGSLPTDRYGEFLSSFSYFEKYFDYKKLLKTYFRSNYEAWISAIQNETLEKGHILVAFSTSCVQNSSSYK